jgi:pimeloyl-ACP methyl ester carboxylesterase
MRFKMNVAVALLAAVPWAAARAQTTEPQLRTEDLFVPYTSTSPVDAGQVTGIHVRHKAGPNPGPVVLFVHGATGPGVPDFDLDYKDYNWMASLAGAGFDTYALDLYGYGSSPRPAMDDPCNASDKQQQDILLSHPLKAVCAPSYGFGISTIRTEWDQIDAVVDYLRRSRSQPKIDIVGWSAGGPRVGGYVSAHGGKINRVVLYAPSPTIPGLSIPDKPSAGRPLYLQTQDVLMHGRWAADEKCEGQVDPGIRAVVWRTTMDWDRLGRSWGAEGEGVMRSPPLTDFGWSPEMAARLSNPTLVVVGEFDRLAARKTVYEQLGSPQKVFMRVACASHFMVWEKQHLALQRMTQEWLEHGTALGQSTGELEADKDGKITSVRQ